MTRTNASPQGHIISELATGEDEALLRALLTDTATWVRDGRAELRVHADTDPDATEGEREQQRAQKREAIARGRAKRYVLALDTAAGRRIVKFAAPASFGNRLLGLAGISIARREHRYHARTEALGLAASRSLGFLEWRQGPALILAAQVQTLFDEGATTVDTFLAKELEQHGEAALEPLAEAIAAMHGARFFHADLKGFHAFVTDVVTSPDGPSRYALRWIDLARVGFRLSRRQRIINLYQALRFVVPPGESAHARFVHHYCKASGWYADAPERGLARVERLLAYKLRTHPYP